MQRPHRITHRVAWMALPLALLAVLTGAMMQHSTRTSSPAGVQVAPPFANTGANTGAKQ